jgi:hypothetical protein
MPIALLVGFVGLLLWNAAAKGEHPLCPITRAFGGECKPPPGTTGPLAERYAAAAASLPSVMDAPTQGGTNRGRRSRGKPSYGTSGRKAPSSGDCPPYPKDLVTKGEVTLRRAAMDAFLRAEDEVGNIPVNSSFRTDEQQISACNELCGGGEAGCEGTCAPSPGGCSASCHRDGGAVDIALNSARKNALERNGFCQPLPDSDAGHFCYFGCK